MESFCEENIFSNKGGVKIYLLEPFIPTKVRREIMQDWDCFMSWKIWARVIFKLTDNLFQWAWGVKVIRVNIELMEGLMKDKLKCEIGDLNIFEFENIAESD